MAQLIVRDTEGSPNGDTTLDLRSGDVVTIGRDPSNRLPLPEETKASRRHCRIGPAEGGSEGWEIHDLGSTNKTRVNGVVVTRQILSHGDVVQVGGTEIRFEDPEEEERLRKAGQEGICFLEWATKERRGQRVMLGAKRTTLGRRESNTVALDDRMCSGHHAEILRDLNGYTLRDLGSTNGSLVNGEPVSEALLTHGARIRLGNSRFVFKDPSMKDIEVELSQFDEDEGWGMMGDIDLSRARGSYAGLLLVGLLFAAAGVGGWWLATQAGPADDTEITRAGLVENGDFEAEYVAWSGDDPETTRVGRTARGGGKALSAANTAEGEAAGPHIVFYDEPIETVAGQGIELKGVFEGGGDGRPELVLQWLLQGSAEGLNTPLSRLDTVAVGSGRWAPFETTIVPPVWATSARLGIWLPVGARAGLDDLSVLRTEGKPHPTFTTGFKTAAVDGSGSVDVAASRTVLVADAHPVVRLSDGRVLDRFVAESVTGTEDGFEIRGRFLDPDTESGGAAGRAVWRKTGEGASIALVAEGAAAVGLQASVPSSHIGGAVNVLGDFPPQSLPAEPGERVENVSRVLAGQPDPTGSGLSTLVSIMRPEGETDVTLELVEGRDPGLFVLRHWLPTSEGQLELITDFTEQKGEARQKLVAAKGLQTSAPGEAIVALMGVAQAYPFDDTVREEAEQLADTLLRQTTDRIQSLKGALAAFGIYRSGDALEAVEQQAAELKRLYLEGREAPGQVREEIEGLVADAENARRRYELDNAGPWLDRVERLYDVLAGAEETKPLAAVYARAVVHRYGDMAAFSPDVQARVDRARELLARLTNEDATRAAVPPAPPR